MIQKVILNSRDEWLHARKNKIGGSDASAIIGMNPYKSNVQLWREKMGIAEPVDISNEPYVKYGNDAEPYLRALFALDFPEYEVHYKENNMFLNSDYPFAHASLDGWLVEKETGRKGVLEIKTTEILQSMQREKWKNKVPDNYYIQVLHYLFVTGWDFVILKGQLKTVFDGIPYLQTKHYFIDRKDVEPDIDYLINAEKNFYYENIQKGIEPPLILPNI